MTDDAWAYRRCSALRQACADLGIKQTFIKPHCPWQNGKVERFNRTLATEWAYRRLYASSSHRTAALAPGSSTTTLDDATAPWQVNRRLTVFHQRDGRVN